MPMMPVQGQRKQKFEAANENMRTKAMKMAEHTLMLETVDGRAPAPSLPAFLHAYSPSNFLAESVKFGYSCEHRLDIGPGQMHPESVHEFPFNGDENRCRACVAGTCVQRVEMRPEGYLLVVHDCRHELS